MSSDNTQSNFFIKLNEFLIKLKGFHTQNLLILCMGFGFHTQIFGVLDMKPKPIFLGVNVWYSFIINLT